MTRIALCGGTYSNPYALRAFVDDARVRGAQRLCCLGDLGAYGAEPEAIWPLLIANGIECIAGNYEVAIGRGDTDCGCGYAAADDNAFAAIAYDYTLRHTSVEFAAWIRTLPTEHRETVDGVTCTWCMAPPWRSTTSGGPRCPTSSTGCGSRPPEPTSSAARIPGCRGPAASSTGPWWSTSACWAARPTTAGGTSGTRC